MDTPKRFACVVMHPDRFPAIITDPFNPPRNKLTAEIDHGAVSIITKPSGGNAKVLVSEPLGNISKVVIQLLSASARRLEVFENSLFRIIVVAGFSFVVLFVSNGMQSALIYLILALAAATLISGPLFFIFNGGLTIHNDVVRFIFFPAEQRKPFYLEVDTASEVEMHQALLSAGAKFDEDESSEEEWECDQCGATVSAIATACPRCGAKFDE